VNVTVFGRFGLFDPVRQVADEIKEKVFFGHRNDLVGNLDKETETFVRLECQSLRDALAKVFSSGGRIDFKGLEIAHFKNIEKRTENIKQPNEIETMLLTLKVRGEKRNSEYSPRPCRRGNKLCGRFASFCAGWLPLPPDEAGTFSVRVAASYAAAEASRWRSDDGASARIASIPFSGKKQTKQT
jgi:hypothetical protein